MSEQKEALKLLSDLGQEWDAQAEITRLRAALADAQAVGFAAGVEAAAKVAVPDERSMHADQSEYMAGARHAGWRIHGEIRALTPLTPRCGC